MGNIIGLIIFGAVIGVLARLVMPGKQSLSVLATVILGVLGALAGYWIAGKLGVDNTGGVDWIRWIISVAAAVVLTFGYEAITSRSKS
ncbi:hypothetical protein GOARA_050_00460 [Gordonia araii NBRC 100433]|uniref:Transglycosylase associated protein n=1 Tax=Gordonia araii NBRC 100433 TaxID=1073574 RepID=G7H2A9_9ACTN|nr:GlsB/YeaQ/YmgE family stress response membrane protein [Gordonia araii]NNG97523.1 GlsB/YeaQ/YmgE family stress response membrane protein [Gordonia araii NBRC 100433]GAB09984.1 hypothetical protein GOARA_050_00460 [Gordonia araii NBRC 100433]